MARKIKKQITGGWVDVSVTPRAMAILDGLNVADELAERIGELLGEYRLCADARDSGPTPAESMEHLRLTVDAIDTLLERLEVIPEDFKALATDYLLKATREHYEQFENRITLELARYRAMCGHVTSTMRQWPSTAGKHPNYLEHKLLAEVAALIQPAIKGREKAAEKAGEILTAAGVHHLHGSPRNLAGHVRKYFKAR